MENIVIGVLVEGARWAYDVFCKPVPSGVLS